MVPRRTSFALCALAALAVAGCSSDKKAGSGSTTTTSSIAIVQQTTTSAPAIVTVASTQPTLGGATTTTLLSTSTTTVGRTVTSPSDNVKKGDKGPGVEQIQTALKQVGYKITVDGDFGSQTDKAVRDFQKKNNLTVDGVVGPKTWTKLKAAASGGTSATTTTVKP